jgi:hypothetical protein
MVGENIPDGDNRLSLRNNCPKFKNIRNTNYYYGSLFQARWHNREITTISFVKHVCRLHVHLFVWNNSVRWIFIKLLDDNSKICRENPIFIKI